MSTLRLDSHAADGHGLQRPRGSSQHLTNTSKRGGVAQALFAALGDRVTGVWGEGGEEAKPLTKVSIDILGPLPP